MKKFRKFFTYLLTTLLTVQGALAAQLLVPVPRAQANGSPEVVINEVMWMGSTISNADEWIELRNTTASPIDMSGWVLTNAATGGDLTIPTGILPANGYFLISNYDDSSLSSILDIDPDYVTTDVSISNTCSPIELMKPGQVEPVDAMGCNSGYFAGENTTIKRSMERNIEIADGTVGTSWHSSQGFANLDDSASPNNFATAKAINDDTAPTTANAIVNDGVGDDIDFSADSTTLSTNWHGFSDYQSSISLYMVGLGTAAGSDDVVAFQMETSTAFTFSALALAENTTYYVTVKAVNGVGMESEAVASDGVTLNTADPLPPVNLSVADTPDDNGGSVQVNWSSSSSPDVVSYQVNYRKFGEVDYISINVGLNTTKVVSGLENSPVTYEFTAEAIDFNSQHSVATDIVSGQALDNLAPVLDSGKLAVWQNKPGEQDQVLGWAGAVSDPSQPVKVELFDRNPGEGFAALVNSIEAKTDGSFSAMGIGDNAYGAVWLILTDSSGNSSQPYQILNDIIGPAAPVLEKVTTNCVGQETCRVNLYWQSDALDAVEYQVSYSHDGVESLTFPLSSKSIALDLTVNREYQFAVYSFDQAGNPSGRSNVLTVRLTKGVKSTVTWVDGKQITRTEGIPGSIEVKTAEAPVQEAILAPPAYAAEPTPSVNLVNTPTPTSAETAGEDNQDWVRIFIVVVILLIIAGSFYALSRSIGEEGSDETIKPPDEDKKVSSPPIETPTKRSRKSRRRRR